MLKVVEAHWDFAWEILMGKILTKYDNKIQIQI